MAYNSLYEWQEIEALELGNKKIDELRKEINNINIQMIEFSLLGETILEWDANDLENYHDFMEFCNRLHANEAEPELMFQDYEHYPEQWYCEGCMGEITFDKIKAYAGLSEEKREAYEAYLTYWDEGTLEDFEERYEGKYESAEDFAEYLCEECGYFKNLPQWLQCCIDYTAVWRNLDTAGDYTEVDGHIFRN